MNKEIKFNRKEVAFLVVLVEAQKGDIEKKINNI